MIPLDDVAYFTWDADKGRRLKDIRGQTSRRELADRLDCSHQYLQKLEDGRADSVKAELLRSICAALGKSIGAIVPTITVSTPTQG